LTGNPTLSGDPAAYLENVAGHALVGCVSVAASGGSCESGALSAGVSSAAGPFINNGPGLNIGSLVANAALGGAAAVAGGGKFDNGAITAAFGYLFNWVFHAEGEIHFASPLQQLFCGTFGVCAPSYSLGFAISTPGSSYPVPADANTPYDIGLTTATGVDVGFDASRTPPPTTFWGWVNAILSSLPAFGFGANYYDFAKYSGQSDVTMFNVGFVGWGSVSGTDQVPYGVQYRFVGQGFGVTTGSSWTCIRSLTGTYGC
jgi:hypothetical protein